jgi:hypothetical protein
MHNRHVIEIEIVARVEAGNDPQLLNPKINEHGPQDVQPLYGDKQQPKMDCSVLRFFGRAQGPTGGVGGGDKGGGDCSDAPANTKSASAEETVRKRGF